MSPVLRLCFELNDAICLAAQKLVLNRHSLNKTYKNTFTILLLSVKPQRSKEEPSTLKKKFEN